MASIKNRIGFKIFVVSIMLLLSISLLPSQAAASPSGLPQPPWWDGSTCDDDYYYAITDVHTVELSASPWSGLNICSSNGGGDVDHEFSDDDDMGYGIDFQCTELVKRYLYLWLNVPSLDLTHGFQVVENYATDFPDTFVAIENDGSSESFPEVGDILSYGDGDPYNHTAIVTAVTVLDAIDGDATLTVIEQNGAASGQTYQNVVDWIVRGGPTSPSDYTSVVVSGWLKPRWQIGDADASGVFTAITASSPTDVWAVGYTGIAYHFDGETWGSDTITGGAVDAYVLLGVTELSSGTVLAVGNDSHYAVATKNPSGSSWSTVSVYRPTTNTWFTAIDSDSSDNAWAVGYTYNGGYRPLIEKYNGTSFVNPTGQPNPFPRYEINSTEYDTKLFSVSVNSSTDIWAVGYYYDSTSRHPISLHYDGTNWTYYAPPEPEIVGETVALPTLTSVTTTNTGVVWAGGGSLCSCK